MKLKIEDLTSYSFVYSICVLFAVGPLIYLIVICSSKGIDTQMHVTNPDEFVLPSFSICSDFRNLIDFDKLMNNRSLYNQANIYFNKTNLTNELWSQFENDAVIGFFGNQMNLSDLLMYTKNLSKVVESISIYGVANLPDEDRGLTSEEIGEKMCRKDIVIKNTYLCIVITCLRNNQRLIISDKKISKSYVRRGVILRFKFIHNEIKNFNYLLIGAHDEPLLIGYEDRLSEIKINKKPHLYQFQIRTYYNILLPDPDTTNCKNYTLEEDDTLFQKHALSRCMFDKLTQKNMVYFPNSINLSWILDHNYSLFLNKRPQYNGLSLDESVESEDAADYFDECEKQFDQPDCLNIIYLIYYLTPLQLDSTIFYDDGTFRYDKEFIGLIRNTDEITFNESELIMHDEQKYLCSVFQLLQSSYPLMTNKYVDAMELKEFVILAASVYGTFTTFRVSQMIKRMILWAYSAFFM